MKRRRSAILNWHSLDHTGSPVSVSPERFASQLRSLERLKVEPLTSIRPGEASAALTFDDGFFSVWEHAAPLLAERRWPATIFVVADYVGRDNDWPTQPRGIPRLPLLDWPRLRELVRHGFSLGAHTCTHPRLDRLTVRESLNEIVRSKSVIEDRAGVAVSSFAWPYGVAPISLRHAVAERFRCAAGTELRFLAPDDDPANLPRLDAYYLPRDTARCFRGVGPSYIAARRVLRGIRQWTSR